MAKSKQTSPRLSTSVPMSKANATDARLNALVPSLASEASPSLVYLAGAVNEVAKNGTAAGVNDFGWVAPDLNNGEPYTVQVEVFGAGGGGGGGGATGVGGGGGGAGGEYACEPMYPIVPNETYSYFVGKGGSPGATSVLVDSTPSIPGANGYPSQFDLRGKGMTGGVLANGGQGGDETGLGIGGRGGTGSVNTIHFDGGSGGTSSAGTMSDNPMLDQGAIGPAHLELWYRLDDKSGTLARDYTSFVLNSSSVTKNTGAIVAPQSTVQCPVQTPFGAATTYNGQPVSGEVMGNCWQFDHGTGSGFIGGINCPNFTLSQETALTVSAWVKGSASATSASDWTDGTHSTGAICCNKDVSQATAGGMGFVIGHDSSGNSQIQFQLTDISRAQQIVSCAGPSAVDGNWHMITATYSVANNRIIIYVDGVAITTTAPTIGTLSGGGFPMSVGYAQAVNKFGFKGYMSNLWIQTAEATASYIANAFGGASVATGGSGGGASGGSAGTGNSGSSGAATVGGAAGTSAAASQTGINTGSGAGASGGNANTGGNNAPTSAPYAGGGGGAGARTAGAPTAFQIEVPCSMSASYSGLDAQGAATGQLYTVSADPNASEADPWYNTAAKQDAICYTGGTSDAPFKGSMNTLITFPSYNSVDGNSGATTDYLSSGDWTIEKTFLKLTIETTNACNLAIRLWASNAIIPTLDSDTTLTAWGCASAASTLIAYIPAGAAQRQVFIDLSGTGIPAALITLAQSNSFTQNGKALQGGGLLLGVIQGSTTFPANIFGSFDDDEAPDWYCAFHGADVNNPEFSAALEVTYIASSSAALTAGKGGDGYIVINFISPQGTPISTVLPAGTTDTSGNALGTGFTADATSYNVWQPGSSPRLLEVWHNANITLSGWANQGSTAQILRYKLMPGNMVWITGIINSSGGSNGVLFTLPVGWRPPTTQMLHFWSLTPGAVAHWFASVANDGSVNLSSNGGVTGTYGINGFVSLDS